MRRSKSMLDKFLNRIPESHTFPLSQFIATGNYNINFICGQETGSGSQSGSDYMEWQTANNPECPIEQGNNDCKVDTGDGLWVEKQLGLILTRLHRDATDSLT